MWEARGRNVLQPLCEGDGQRPECTAASTGGRGATASDYPPPTFLYPYISICNTMSIFEQLFEQGPTKLSWNIKSGTYII